jgi:hypothetical protein
MYASMQVVLRVGAQQIRQQHRKLCVPHIRADHNSWGIGEVNEDVASGMKCSQYRDDSATTAAAKEPSKNTTHQQHSIASETG